MNLEASHSPLRVLARRPYLSISVAVHGALLALLYYVGRYQLELRQQEAEVASSLRATSVAGTAKRLQDLQTIKQLLEKSADRVDSQREPTPASLMVPQTPEEIVERAREISKAIDALDEEIQAEELAQLTTVLEPQQLPSKPDGPDETESDARETGDRTQAAVTAEMAASEVAALEAKARATLVKRQQRLEAKANGVPIEGAPHANGHESGVMVRAEIADFIGQGNRTNEMKRSKTYASLNFFHDGAVGIPPVDATSLVRGRGRMLGAGGEFANRVYLNSWYIIGPFPGRHGGALFDNPAYPPEKAVLLDAVYYGKDQRLLSWRYVTAQRYPLVPPDSVEDSVYYGYTEVFVDQDCDLNAWIGADDDVQIYLNGHLVWEGGNVNKRPYFDAVFNTSNTYLRDYNRTEGKRVLHFNEGRNQIFFKLSNGPNDPYLSMVLTR